MSGNLGSWGESLAAAACDLDLGAGDVELRRGAGVVDGKLLDTEQVFAGSNTRRDGDGVVVCVVVNTVQGTGWMRTYPSNPK